MLSAHTPKVSPPRTDDSSLVQRLNALLAALQIPLRLESPTELTPLLLFAMLESLISARIPFPFSSPSLSPRGSNVQRMKVFLGVLENDVIKTDVGLSDVDPIRLSEGRWEETVFVGEVLCWVGTKLGLLSEEGGESSDVMVGGTRTNLQEDEEDEAEYASDPDIGVPSPPSLISSAVNTDSHTTAASSLSLHNHHEGSSDTSPTSSLREPQLLFPQAPKRRPRCIHEITFSPNLSPLSEPRSPCNCSSCSKFDLSHTLSDRSESSKARYPVRRDGYIRPVDEESELLFFEHSRMENSHSHNLSQDLSREEHSDLLSHVQLEETRARTLMLLNERARLLEELAKLTESRPS